ncbi:MAG TPA: hypothetical protein PK513_00815 [Alphaproteobacteria bacterium]|nr:hypothetical protein [Alphaproteobacteria bacterium]USO05897.1 MAG: hypothetical protein H6859_01455 [Rhodospirillales bacterium]HOO81030.1 hypothetical protein [Alphaproteobacteria bacterium]
MFKILKNKAVHLQAAFVVGFLTSTTNANAQIGAGHDFSDIARNITESVEELPGMVTSISYMIGLLMGVLGVMKLKDHVENPSQTPLKDGAIRLAAGGALFALPIVFESMLNTIGTTGASIEPAALNRAKFNVN